MDIIYEEGDPIVGLDTGNLISVMTVFLNEHFKDSTRDEGSKPCIAIKQANSNGEKSYLFALYPSKILGEMYLRNEHMTWFDPIMKITDFMWVELEQPLHFFTNPKFFIINFCTFLDGDCLIKFTPGIDIEDMVIKSEPTEWKTLVAHDEKWAALMEKAK